MSKTEKLEEVERKIALNHKGRPMEGNLLYPDPTPMAPPIGYEKQPSMVDIIREQVRQAGLTAAQQGFETFEEADDFDVPDDPFPVSEHEVDEETEVPASVLRDRAKKAAEDAKQGDRKPKEKKEKAPEKTPTPEEGDKGDKSPSPEGEGS